MLACRNFVNVRREKLKECISQLKVKPTLVAIIVGDDCSALAYIDGIKRTANKLGIDVIIRNYEEAMEEVAFIKEIEALNANADVHGVLVQMPLPKHISKNAVIGHLDPKKDVDGFTKENLGQLMLGEEGLFPCTAEAVMAIIDDASIDVSGKEVVIIGRSNVVGKPLGIMMLNKSATVTTVHSKTKDLAFHTQRADILVVAVGRANFIDASMIKDDAIVIDVGINVIDGKLMGDVDQESIKSKTSLYTPVPGGVGPMTTTLLFEKVVMSAMGE